MVEVDDLGLCLHNIPFDILKNELNWYFTCETILTILV